MRIRHLGIVVQDLEQTAEFYENVLGFKRLGDARTPGHYPGKALDLSDGEVNYSLLQPNPEHRTLRMDVRGDGPQPHRCDDRGHRVPW